MVAKINDIDYYYRILVFLSLSFFRSLKTSRGNINNSSVVAKAIFVFFLKKMHRVRLIAELLQVQEKDQIG